MITLLTIPSTTVCEAEWVRNSNTGTTVSVINCNNSTISVTFGKYIFPKKSPRCSDCICHVIKVGVLASVIIKHVLNAASVRIINEMITLCFELFSSIFVLVSLLKIRKYCHELLYLIKLAMTLTTFEDVIIFYFVTRAAFTRFVTFIIACYLYCIKYRRNAKYI